jgi:hypothetical protein
VDGAEATYIVHRGKVHAIFYGVALEFSIVKYEYFAICVVDGDRLGIPILGLVALLGCAPAAPPGSNTLRPCVQTSAPGKAVDNVEPNCPTGHRTRISENKRGETNLGEQSVMCAMGARSGTRGQAS